MGKDQLRAGEYRGQAPHPRYLVTGDGHTWEVQEWDTRQRVAGPFATKQAALRAWTTRPWEKEAA